MKKTRLLPLLALLVLGLCIWASPASAAAPEGQVYITSVTDAYGAVTALTDGSTTTTWVRRGQTGGPDLTLNLYNSKVGEIWIRNGHCYSQNYYNHHDRPSVVRVTLWYTANRYTSTSVTYRYRMTEGYRPTASSAEWYNGYQRLLLPKAISGVTKIELTVESTISGYGATGAAITDIIVAQGSHATATPAPRATATPRRYVQYVTPTPAPYTPTPSPTPQREEIIIPNTPLVERITPIPRPTATPLVELITPVIMTPVPAPSTEYPSFGVEGTLTKIMATRSGPATGYDEPGSFGKKGDKVNVVGKIWDENNQLFWVQVEFNHRGEWLRVYTTDSRVDVDMTLVPVENTFTERYRLLSDQAVYFGPGYQYRVYNISKVAGDRVVHVYTVENGWAQIRYRDWAIDKDRRGWVPLSALVLEPEN